MASLAPFEDTEVVSADLMMTRQKDHDEKKNTDVVDAGADADADLI